MKIYRLTALPNGFSKLARAAFNTLDGYLYLGPTKPTIWNFPGESSTHSRSLKTGSLPGLLTG